MSQPSHISYVFNKSQGFNRYLIENRTVENSCGFIKDIIPQSSSILDIGCGPGSITRGFAKLAPKAHVIGVDISEAQVQLATELSESHQLKNLTFQQANILKLPFPDASFDFIFAQTVLAHVSELKTAFAEVKRVLKPNGVFAIKEIIASNFYFTPYSELVYKYRSVMNRGVLSAGGDPDIGLLIPEMIIEAGFSIVRQSMIWERSPKNQLDSDYFTNVISPVTHGELGEKAIQNGWMTQQEIKALEALCLKLKHNPNAMWALPFVEVVAKKDMMNLATVS